MAHDIKIVDSSIETKLPSSFNVGRVVANVDLFFSPIRDDSTFKYHVHDITGDIATLTLAVHKDVFKAFTAMLETLAKLTFQINRSVKHKAFENREVSLDEINDRERLKASYTERVCSVYKKYIDKGLIKNQAISATNIDIKKEFPFSAHHLIVEELSRNGLFKSK